VYIYYWTQSSDPERTSCTSFSLPQFYLNYNKTHNDDDDDDDEITTKFEIKYDLHKISPKN